MQKIFGKKGLFALLYSCPKITKLNENNMPFLGATFGKKMHKASR
jgi:hypothetical protein